MFKVLFSLNLLGLLLVSSCSIPKSTERRIASSDNAGWSQYLQDSRNSGRVIPDIEAALCLKDVNYSEADREKAVEIFLVSYNHKWFKPPEFEIKKSINQRMINAMRSTAEGKGAFCLNGEKNYFEVILFKHRTNSDYFYKQLSKEINSNVTAFTISQFRDKIKDLRNHFGINHSDNTFLWDQIDPELYIKITGPAVR